MILFKKKDTQDSVKPPTHRTLQEIVQERILTAEGWRRRRLKKLKKSK